MTAHAIAKILGIDLEPWQEFVLQHMLAGYRQPDPPAVAEAELAKVPPWCGAGHPTREGVYCGMISGHSGDHQASGVHPWAGVHPCGAQMPAARIAATCTQPAGHPGKHVVGSGELTGSSWYSPE